MLDLVLTNQFKKDLKRIRKRGYKIQLLDEVLKNLQNEIPLDEKYRDHALNPHSFTNRYAFRFILINLNFPHRKMV
ncbi:MAG: type II toxin-antitoxin system YafQ family toxin [Veillonellaceae bacterium]|nr:type II toxin-antitoxin system YafQ family toxin [Veillonellaceae bacterium]MCI7266586.1 type II toxin-antitoxin system YafQ family toxin [Veillonellaceae bacterium]